MENLLKYLCFYDFKNEAFKEELKELFKQEPELFKQAKQEQDFFSIVERTDFFEYLQSLKSEFQLLNTYTYQENLNFLESLNQAERDEVFSNFFYNAAFDYINNEKLENIKKMDKEKIISFYKKAFLKLESLKQRGKEIFNDLNYILELSINEVLFNKCVNFMLDFCQELTQRKGA